MEETQIAFGGTRTSDGSGPEAQTYSDPRGHRARREEILAVRGTRWPVDGGEHVRQGGRDRGGGLGAHAGSAMGCARARQYRFEIERMSDGRRSRAVYEALRRPAMSPSRPQGAAWRLARLSPRTVGGIATLDQRGRWRPQRIGDSRAQAPPGSAAGGDGGRRRRMAARHRESRRHGWPRFAPRRATPRSTDSTRSVALKVNDRDGSRPTRRRRGRQRAGTVGKMGDRRRIASRQARDSALQLARSERPRPRSPTSSDSGRTREWQAHSRSGPA